MPSLRLALVLAALTISSCAVPWREEASAPIVGCSAKEIAISRATAGTTVDTWQAQCRGKTYTCSAPNSGSGQASCAETSDSRVPTPTLVPVPSLPSAGAMPAEDPTPPSSIRDKLLTLKQLHEQGLITKDEYDAKRKALLDAY